MPFTKKFKYVDYPEIGTVFYEKSSKAKRVVIYIKSPTDIRVAVPSFVSIRKAESFVDKKLNWIKKHQSVLKNKTNVLDRDVQITLQDKRIMAERVEYLAEKFNFKYGKITLRKMETRWGSCSAQNNISLNIGLVALPSDLRDYVILHELVHTKIKNHGSKFWNELGKIVQNPKFVSRKLKSEFGLFDV